MMSENRTGKIKIVIVDDNVAIRAIMKDILAFEADMEVIGEADSMKEGKNKIVTEHPDIVLVDLLLDDPGGGFKILENVQQTQRPVRAIVVSAYDISVAPQCFAQGAQGFVSKENISSELVLAIRCVYSGTRYPPP